MAADPTYTVFVRVPIPRGSFVDPPPVSWDPAKDEALWKILSGAAQKEIDWNLMADRFEVQVDFLVHQVGYLTERHASQVRAQVRKATAAAKGSAAPSPIPGSDSTGVGNLRTASALSVRRDSPRTEVFASGIAGPAGSGAAAAAAAAVAAALGPRPTISRNASANTAVFREPGTSSLKMGSRPGTRLADASSMRRRRLSSLQVAPTSPSHSQSQSQSQAQAVSSPRTTAAAAADGTASPEPAESASSSSEDSSPAQSRIFKRPPRYQTLQDDQSRYHDDDDDDGDESEPAFQRYEPVPPGNTSSHDLTSTVRGNPADARRRAGTRNVGSGTSQGIVSQTSDSSTSSQLLRSRHERLRTGEQQHPQGGAAVSPSPRRTTELAATRDTGSDGTPSMGSSYSDLDDTSVTQSALEEAMASQINRGARSRFSISAFRSHYTSGSHQ